jgi:hypothetical protein
MRFPSHLLQPETFRSEPMMAAMAAVAVGMFFGAWVIGPAITYNNADSPAQAATERTTFQDMVARPDPMPYRAPTPAFDRSGPPEYAAIARERARTESGDPADAGWFDSTGVRGYRSSRARPFDRHRFY